MARPAGSGLAGGHHHGDHRSGRVLSGWDLTSHLAHVTPGGRPVSCGPRRPTVVWTRSAGGSSNETLFHRGRKGRPAVSHPQTACSAGHERLDERGHDRMLLGLRLGDPNDEVLGAWLAKESVRDVYLTDDVNKAGTLIDKAIAGCADDVAEIQLLGRTLAAMAHRDPGPPSHRRQQRPDRSAQPVRQEGEAMRSRLPNLRALPPTSAPPRRRCHLATTSMPPTHQNPRSLLKRVGPRNVHGDGPPMTLKSRRPTPSLRRRR
jgi:hypothetical protein